MERKVKRFASKVVSLALALSMFFWGGIAPKVEAYAEGTLRCEWHSHDRKSMDWTLDQISETSATITFKAYGESGIKMSYDIRQGDISVQGYNTTSIGDGELEFSQGSDSNCGNCNPYYAAPIELSSLSPDTTYSIVMDKFYLNVNDNTSMNDFTNYYFVFKTNAHDFSEGWHTDPENHWHECLNSNCAETNPRQIDLAPHTPDKDAPTATEPVVCTECGYEIQPATGTSGGGGSTENGGSSSTKEENNNGGGSSSNANTPTETAEQQQHAAFVSKVLDYENQLQTATDGSTVKIEGDESFNSLPASLINAFMENGKVDMEFTYSYKGQPYRIVIPAGTKLESGIPWYGPMYLWGHFGNPASLAKVAPQLTDAEREALYEVFDAELYASLYADVVAVYGTEKASLFEHFVTYGMNEGRTMCSDFRIIEVYNSRVDLRDLYKDDWYKYYIDYAVNEGL